MEKKFTLVFDEIMRNQLLKDGKDANLQGLLARVFDKLEEKGPDAGKLIDSQLFIYEIKNKHLPLRLYFNH